MDWLLGLASAYDVMGLTPDASDEEIENQFDLLVNHKGYRIGLRRGSWRQRLSEIKSAHATLSDPVKRRAHDESLGIASDAPVWTPGSRSDHFSDSLVRPAPERWSRTRGAPDVRPAPVHDEPVRAEQSAWPARHEADDDRYAEAAADVDHVPWLRRTPAKTWAVGAAVTLGLSAVLFASWQQDSPRAGPSNRSQSFKAAQPANIAAPRLAALPAANAAVPPASEELSPEEKAAAAGDARAASASLSGWLGTEGEIAADVPASAAASTAIPPGANPAAAPAPAQVPVAATQAPAPANPAPSPSPPVVQVAQAQTIAAPAPVAPPQVRASAPPAPPPRADATRPPRLVSGAPSDRDNKHGQYRGSVVAQFTVGREGRVSNCSVVRTSGNAKLDALTCRLLEQRARFEPAQDSRGAAVPSDANATYVWGRGHRSKQ